MQEERILYKRWRRSYLLQILISLAVLAFAFYAGRIILFSLHHTWHQSDFGYSLLSFLNHNVHLAIVTICLIITMLITLRHFRKVSYSVIRIADAVEKIYIDDSAEIELPRELRGLESRLKEIRIDLTESKREADEAVRRKNDMLMYMAHDLKTPLASIIGYSSLLEDEPDIPAETQKKYAGIIHRKALRLEDLVNEFFDIARFNFTRMTLNKSRLNLSMMISQMLAEFSPLFSSKNLSTDLEVPGTIHAVCDADKIERVFDNLFKNIVSYSYPDSEVRVELKETEDGILLTTENHGTTIPSEMLPHIFEQFFRLDSARSSESGGSGLGLAAAKEIIELHGGNISCESEDETIRFRVLIPVK